MPPLQDLVREIQAEPEPINDPRDIFSDAMQIVEPTARPGDAAWVHAVYIDPAVFPSEVSRARIEAHYKAILGDRAFVVQDLNPKDLEQGSPLPIDAESIFLQRGFAADIDGQELGRGNHDLTTTYLARNRAACHHHLSMLQGVQELSGETDARWATLLTAESLARWMGEDAGRSVPLIERDGVLLPCLNFSGPEDIHMAYARAFHPALNEGRADPFHLTYGLPGEVAEQAIFELQHAVALFNGASGQAVLLWQCQILAFLRKTAWLIGFSVDVDKQEQSIAREKVKIRRYLLKTKRQGEVVRVDLDTFRLPAEGDRLQDSIERRVPYGTYYNRRKEEKAARRRHDAEAKRLARAGARDHRVGGNDAAFGPIGPDTIVVKYPDQTAFALATDIYTTALGERADLGVGQGLSDCTAVLSSRQVLVSALNGSTYMPPFDVDCEEDHDDPLHILQPIALWIGELKRRRSGVLDHRMANLLDAVDGEGTGGVKTLFDAVIEPRLGAGVWQALRQDAAKMREPERRTHPHRLRMDTGCRAAVVGRAAGWCSCNPRPDARCPGDGDTAARRSGCKRASIRMREAWSR